MGDPLMVSSFDEAAQDAAAKELSRRWGCTFRRFARYSPIDWFAEKNGHMYCVAEFKNRNVPRAKYPTIYLSMRKWISLQNAVTGLGLNAVLVVRFTDQLAYTDLVFPFTGEVTINGNSKRCTSHDIEPVLEIPIADFTEVK